MTVGEVLVAVALIAGVAVLSSFAASRIGLVDESGSPLSCVCTCDGESAVLHVQRKGLGYGEIEGE